MRRQQGMRLDERYVPYLQMVGLYHLARLNERWFRLDEPLFSAFVEHWHPETHMFHMPFGECTITLQDVAYQLGLPIDGHYISGCLTDFQTYIEGDRPAWVWFEELLGALPPANQIQKFAVNCSWFQETFGELPEGADEPTVRRLEDMSGYSWGSPALSWLYRCMCRVANRHVLAFGLETDELALTIGMMKAEIS
ncbi:protein MAIN-LIKE 1-like [Arachis ipaensis]|uniref:protein MAIN-LIKE 1-like n=1 Tax=Arachis ipaensis TaxID=130454 RepID=UPI0007AEF501|nr:protein MAIN-LIKE 1-like [Arachis ipaensis]